MHRSLKYWSKITTVFIFLLHLLPFVIFWPCAFSDLPSLLIEWARWKISHRMLSTFLRLGGISIGYVNDSMLVVNTDIAKLSRGPLMIEQLLSLEQSPDHPECENPRYSTAPVKMGFLTYGSHSFDFVYWSCWSLDGGEKMGYICHYFSGGPCNWAKKHFISLVWQLCKMQE